jgi:hypothetical protein
VKKINIFGGIKLSKNRKKTYRKVKRKLLKALVHDRNLDPVERMANRLGYMGTGFIMTSPYLLQYDNIGAYTYIIGALLSLPQVIYYKVWNLVVVNINLLIGYGLYIVKSIMG